MILDYKTAKKKFLSAQINGCKEFFVIHEYFLEAGYCDMILDDIDNARKEFESIEKSDIRAHWALVMLDFINGCVARYPTYFELRNFLEIDLGILIMYCKGDYVEKIIRYADYMFTINPEVYKFIGRVLFKNDLKPQAMFFLNRAKDNFYNDPELHYILAEWFKSKNDVVACKNSLRTCLEILPEYAPAKLLMKTL